MENLLATTAGVGNDDVRLLGNGTSVSVFTLTRQNFTSKSEKWKKN